VITSQWPLPDNTQHSQQTNIHAPGGIRTHNLCMRAAADLRIRARGHWDRLHAKVVTAKLMVTTLVNTDVNQTSIRHKNRGADKSLARPWKETSYSDQDLRRTNNSNILLLFVRRKSWYSVVSLGRCSLFPSRVGLRIYQHPGKNTEQRLVILHLPAVNQRI